MASVRHYQPRRAGWIRSGPPWGWQDAPIVVPIPRSGGCQKRLPPVLFEVRAASEFGSARVATATGAVGWLGRSLGSRPRHRVRLEGAHSPRRGRRAARLNVRRVPRRTLMDRQRGTRCGHEGGCPGPKSRLRLPDGDPRERRRSRSCAQAVSPAHCSYCWGVHPRWVMRSCQVLGWLSIQSMSLPRATSSLGLSAPLSLRLSTIARWLAWYSVLMRFQSASMSGSRGGRCGSPLRARRCGAFLRGSCARLPVAVAQGRVLRGPAATSGCGSRRSPSAPRDLPRRSSTTRPRASH